MQFVILPMPAISKHRQLPLILMDTHEQSDSNAVQHETARFRFID